MYFASYLFPPIPPQNPSLTLPLPKGDDPLFKKYCPPLKKGD
jgi:hypothetical protein